MKLLRISMFMLVGSLLGAPALHAAQVNLQWQEPDKFRDIDAGHVGSKVKYQQRVIDELGKYIQDAADKYLEPNQQLRMTITDIDLAGDVQYFFTRYPGGVRVVNNAYFPSIEFSYELLDENNIVLAQGEENVKDIGFMFSGTSVVKNAPLGYEKRMIDDWFRKTFSQH